MTVGDIIPVSGCVTQEKFIAGRTLSEIEKIIGFHPGRLSRGVTVAVLIELPQLDQFDLAAYSNVATHRLTPPVGLDIAKLKVNARATWSLLGPGRLVKVLPEIRHDASVDPDMQYPPGHGAPQWRIKTPLKARVSGILSDYPNARYVVANGLHR